MKYVQLKKEDYDRSVKLNGQLCLCYSASRFKKVKTDSTNVVGEIKKGDSKKEPSAKLKIDSKLVSVYDNGTFSRLLYKYGAYIAVEGSDDYIAVLESRLPVLLWLLGIIVIGLVAIVMLVTPPETEETITPYNALPPVDAYV